MAINAPPETTPRMPPPSTTSPSFVLSPRSSLPFLRRPRRRLISSTTGWSGPGCVLEVPGVVEEAILLEALVIGLRSGTEADKWGANSRLADDGQLQHPHSSSRSWARFITLRNFFLA